MLNKISRLFMDLFYVVIISPNLFPENQKLNPKCAIFFLSVLECAGKMYLPTALRLLLGLNCYSKLYARLKLKAIYSKLFTKKPI